MLNNEEDDDDVAVCAAVTATPAVFVGLSSPAAVWKDIDEDVDLYSSVVE